jgi:hypothetical protein
VPSDAGIRFEAVAGRLAAGKGRLALRQNEHRRSRRRDRPSAAPSTPTLLPRRGRREGLPLPPGGRGIQGEGGWCLPRRASGLRPWLGGWPRAKACFTVAGPHRTRSEPPSGQPATAPSTPALLARRGRSGVALSIVPLRCSVRESRSPRWGEPCLRSMESIPSQRRGVSEASRPLESAGCPQTFRLATQSGGVGKASRPAGRRSEACGARAPGKRIIRARQRWRTLLRLAESPGGTRAGCDSEGSGFGHSQGEPRGSQTTAARWGFRAGPHRGPGLPPRQRSGTPRSLAESHGGTQAGCDSEGSGFGHSQGEPRGSQTTAARWGSQAGPRRGPDLSPDEAPGHTSRGWRRAPRGTAPAQAGDRRPSAFRPAQPLPSRSVVPSDLRNSAPGSGGARSSNAGRPRSLVVLLAWFARIHRAGAGHSGGHPEPGPQIELEEQPQGQEGDQADRVHTG